MIGCIREKDKVEASGRSRCHTHGMTMTLLLTGVLASNLFCSPPAHGIVECASPDATLRTIPKFGDDRVGPARSLTLAVGYHVVELRRPGFRPHRGTVSVVAGKTLTLSGKLAETNASPTGEVWSIIALAGGAAMLTTAGVMEATGVDDSAGVQQAEVALLALGAAAFITGGMTLYWLRDRVDTSPTSGPFTMPAVTLGIAPQPNGAALSLQGSF
jgi:hypothetical protein